MTTLFLLLSFELCLGVLMRVKAGVLAVKEGVWQSMYCMHLAPLYLAVLPIPGGQRVKVSLLVSS